MSAVDNAGPQAAPIWVDTREAWDRVSANIAKASRLAVDTEGDGLFRYQAKLCMVQISDGDTTWIVDPLVFDAATAISPVFGAASPTKVIHDASFDARMLRDAGVPLGALFDTSVAARFASEPGLGLAALVNKYVGVQLEKAMQHEDWGRRPVDAAGLTYLADDVRYLLPLADALLRRVVELGIEDEVNEECDYVRRSALVVEEPRPQWLRVKGWDTLDEVGRAVLRELCLARETQARAADVPPYRIAMNSALLDVARAKPRGMDDLKRIKGVPRVRETQDKMLAAVQAGRTAGRLPDGEMPMPDEVPSAEERTAKKLRHKRLSEWRDGEAKRRGVDTQAVLPGHCFHEVIARNPEEPAGLLEVDGFGAFRVERYGAAIVAALHGPT